MMNTRGLQRKAYRYEHDSISNSGDTLVSQHQMPSSKGIDVAELSKIVRFVTSSTGP